MFAQYAHNHFAPHAHFTSDGAGLPPRIVEREDATFVDRGPCPLTSSSEWDTLLAECSVDRYVVDAKDACELWRGQARFVQLDCPPSIELAAFAAMQRRVLVFREPNEVLGAIIRWVVVDVMDVIGVRTSANAPMFEDLDVIACANPPSEPDVPTPSAVAAWLALG